MLKTVYIKNGWEINYPFIALAFSFRLITKEKNSIIEKIPEK